MVIVVLASVLILVLLAAGVACAIVALVKHDVDSRGRERAAMTRRDGR